MKRFALLVLIAVNVVLHGQDCNYSISGKVLDDHDRTPLSFAEVYIEELGRGAVVDSAGNYTIRNICPGEYTLTAYHIGCEPESVTIAVNHDVKNLNFYPEHHSELLGEAQIIGEVNTTTAEPVVQLEERELERSRGRSVGEALEQVGGVNALSSGSSIVKPMIHGLYGNRVLTLNNGIRQEDQQWGLEHGLNTDLFAFDQVSVVKGAASVEYGTGAVGGVVKLNPPALPFGNRDLQGSLYLIGESNGAGGSASAELRQGVGQDMAYRVQLSGKKLGDRSAPHYTLSNTAVEELNASFEYGYRFRRFTFNLYYSMFSSNLGILRAAHIGNLSDLQRAISSDEPLYVVPFTYEVQNPRQNLAHNLVKLQARYRIDAESLLEVVYGFQHNHRQEFDVRRGGRSEIPANDLVLRTQTVDVKFRKQRSGSWSSAYGVSGMLQANSNVAGTGFRPFLPNYNLYRGGAFAVEEYRLNDWKFEAGLRYDYEYTLVQKYDRRNELVKPEFRFHSLAASAGATYSFSENVQLSSLLAYAYRPPHVNELMSEGFHHGAAIIVYGDQSLVPERSINFANTLQWNFSERVQAMLTAYLNPFENYIYQQPQREPALTIRGAAPVHRHTQTDAILAGADLTMDVAFSDQLHYKITAGYVRGYDQSADDHLVLMPPPQLTHVIRYSTTDKPIITHSFAELEHKMVARQRQYPEGQDVAAPPDGYQLLALSVGKSFHLNESGSRLNVSLLARNLLNTAYRDYLNRFRYYADNRGINVMLKINYEF